eukprot:8898145-Ditylum_brightwellii.AAC.1
MRYAKSQQTLPVPMWYLRHCPNSTLSCPPLKPDHRFDGIASQQGSLTINNDLTTDMINKHGTTIDYVLMMIAPSSTVDSSGDC